jgi:hypothetical protein
LRNFSGEDRNSTISRNSSLASSTPATSAKVTPVPSSGTTRARARPIDIIPAPGFMRRNTSSQNPPSSSIGNSHTMNSDEKKSLSCIPPKAIFLASSSLTRSGSSTRMVSQRSPLFFAFSSEGVARIRSLPISTSEICPPASRCLNSEYEIRFPEGPDRESSMAANKPSSRYTIHVRFDVSVFGGVRGAAGSMGIGFPSDLLAHDKARCVPNARAPAAHVLLRSSTA